MNRRQTKRSYLMVDDSYIPHSSFIIHHSEAEGDNA